MREDLVEYGVPWLAGAWNLVDVENSVILDVIKADEVLQDGEQTLPSGRSEADRRVIFA